MQCRSFAAAAAHPESLVCAVQRQLPAPSRHHIHRASGNRFCRRRHPQEDRPRQDFFGWVVPFDVSVRALRRSTRTRSNDSQSLDQAIDGMHHLISRSPTTLLRVRHARQRRSFRFPRTADDVLAAWARQRRCEDTFDPGIHDAVTEAVRACRPWRRDMGNATRDVLQSCKWHAGGRRMESHVGTAGKSADPSRGGRARPQVRRRSAEPIHRYRLDGKDPAQDAMRRTFCYLSGITRRCTTRSRSS